MVWQKIKAEYIAGGISYRKLAEKHGVSFNTLKTHAVEEQWHKLRQQKDEKATTKAIEILSDKSADKMTRVLDLTDKLLDKLEQAISELDTQLYKDIVRTKVIEYNHELRPDKPTKETIHEEEKVIEVKSIVDRSGLKAVASSLRDIKEIQMLKSELDKQEQQARIAKLQKEAEEEKEDKDITIVFGSDTEDYSI